MKKLNLLKLKKLLKKMNDNNYYNEILIFLIF